MTMGCNMGKVEQGIRFVAAIAIGLMYFSGFLTGSYAEPLLFLAFYLGFTAFRRCCPVYNLLGRRTCFTEGDESEKKVEISNYDPKDKTSNQLQ